MPHEDSEDLRVALSDGACLVESSAAAPSPDLRSVLVNRLSRYYDRRGSGSISDSRSLEETQFITAREALSVICRVQHVLGGADTDTSKMTDIPLIGTRDLGEIRTLLSVVFKWGVDPLLSKVVLAWPNRRVPSGPRIIDLTTSAEDYELLSSLVADLMMLLFPGGLQGGISQTLVSTTVLDRHALDILSPCITLGWVPKSIASESRPPLTTARSFTMRLLNFLQPSKAIMALGSILSSAPNTIPHVKKACGTLLSHQLLRPQGIRGLFAAVFGDDSPATDDVPMEKLEHVARVLSTVPANMNPDDYFRTIIPRIMDLLSSREPPAYTRAAAFAISRMLSPNDAGLYYEITSGVIFSFLHQPFLELTAEHTNVTFSSSSPSQSTPDVALSTLITLVSNADPSPILMAALLSPITPALYSLFHHMEKVKTSDPSLKESLQALLVTWGKIVAKSEGIDILWHIIARDAEGWQVDLEGHIRKLTKSEQPSPLSFLTPEDLRRANELDDLKFDANILDLYPDPIRFVRFLKAIDRADISSDLFVKLLETYRNHKSQAASDPTQMLLYLQIIMQMQTQLSDGKTSSNILCKPAHLLSFIKHVLDPVDPGPLKTHNGGEPDSVFRIDGLHSRVIEGELDDESDSGDDMSGSEVVGADHEMIETALNLLLSILEANADLSARTVPVLNDIFSLLEPLVKESSSIGPPAREARMVMTARLASRSTLGSSGSRRSTEDHDSAQEIYQKALKLLQDPILPVRAHGLLLLRQLVSPAPRGSGKLTSDDYALIPAILSIFLQSIQDDDSYLFLNAVQGLAAMVDTFGKDVLRSLIGEYAGGLDGLGSTNLTQRDLDTRVRVGEALGIVIRQHGNTLGIYADILIPPLLTTLRSHHVPITLRTSSISLLAACVRTNPLVVLPYVTDLANAIVDLLQLETVPANPRSTKSDNDTTDQVPTMDSDPTSMNSKLPPFRRAALHFLSLLFHETTKQIYESSFGRSILPDGIIRRAKTTLSYVASTDQDTLVRVMAREAGEVLEQMQRAIIGL